MPDNLTPKPLWEICDPDTALSFMDDLRRFITRCADNQAEVKAFELLARCHGLPPQISEDEIEDAFARLSREQTAKGPQAMTVEV